MYGWIVSHSTYLMVLLGLIIGVPVVYRTGFTFNKKSRTGIIPVCVLFSLASVASVLLFASLENLLFSGLWLFGAVSTYGIYLISPLLLAVFAPGKQRAAYFSAYALYVCPSMILQRIRCLMTGCCIGKVIGSGSLRYPTREAEILFYLVMMIVFVKKARTTSISERKDWFPVLMMSYSVFRFICEWFREGTGTVHPAHIWSVLVFLIGLSVYIELHKKTQLGR